MSMDAFYDSLQEEIDSEIRDGFPSSAADVLLAPSTYDTLSSSAKEPTTTSSSFMSVSPSPSLPVATSSSREIPVANSSMTGREYLKSIDARCMAVKPDFYVCSDVKDKTGAANVSDGVLMSVNELDAGHACWRVYDPPMATFVCSTSKRNAMLGMQEMSAAESGLRRAVHGKVDLVSPANPKLVSYGDGLASNRL